MEEISTLSKLVDGMKPEWDVDYRPPGNDGHSETIVDAVQPLTRGRLQVYEDRTYATSIGVPSVATGMDLDEVSEELERQGYERTSMRVEP